MFKKLSFFLFLIFVLTILLFAFFRFLFPLIQPKKGNLSVTTPFQTASVYLDNEKLGQTPVDSKNLRVGDHTLKIESEGKVWETKTTLTTNTFNRVVLNLSKVDSFTSGENLFFRPNQSGLTILSKPEGAKVFVNGEEKGRPRLS